MNTRAAQDAVNATLALLRREPPPPHAVTATMAAREMGLCRAGAHLAMQSKIEREGWQSCIYKNKRYFWPPTSHAASGGASTGRQGTKRRRK